MEWYIVFALIILLAVVLFIKNPSTGKTLSTPVVTFLRLNESIIVQGVYNALPPQIKIAVPSIVVAQIIDFVLDMIEGLLQNGKVN